MNFLRWIFPVWAMYAKIRLNLCPLSLGCSPAIPVRIEMLVVQIRPGTVSNLKYRLKIPEISKSDKHNLRLAITFFSAVKNESLHF